MWKALLVKMNSKVANVIGRIQYHLKVIKGIAIADHVANNVVENYDPNFDLSNGDMLSVEDGGWMNEWWTMYFDGVVNISGNGAGALIISLEKKQYLVSVKLSFKCTKNTVEYEACIIDLKDALELKVEKLDVYGDSMLIICQVKGKCAMSLAESIFFNLRVKLKKIKTWTKEQESKEWRQKKTNKYSINLDWRVRLKKIKLL